MNDKDMNDWRMQDLKDEQKAAKYRCPKCGWVGKIEEMDDDFDCADEYDAVFSPFCCPNKGCWEYYSFIEDWEIVDE